jgi:hypothetical protein
LTASPCRRFGAGSTGQPKEILMQGEKETVPVWVEIARAHAVRWLLIAEHYESVGDAGKAELAFKQALRYENVAAGTEKFV